MKYQKNSEYVKDQRPNDEVMPPSWGEHVGTWGIVVQYSADSKSWALPGGTLKKTNNITLLKSK